MVRVITAETKHNCEHLLGQFLDESHYDIIADEDMDFYGPCSSLTCTGNGEKNILFSLRKGVFNEELQKAAYDGLIKAAAPSQNRGMAAGPKGDKLQGRDWVSSWQIDCLSILMNPARRLDDRDPLSVHVEQRNSYKEDSSRGLVWLRSKVIKLFGEYDGFFDRWIDGLFSMSNDDRVLSAKHLYNECVSQTTYANQVYSGIAGFFDRYPRYPWGRVCSYNEKNPEMFAKCFPYIRKLNEEFKSVLPKRHAAQSAKAALIDSRFLVGGNTVFTTLTINNTFRTAAHRDAGDLAEGFSNLGVISTGKDFAGGMLVLPEYRVAINIRPGDLLLIANHDAIHGNTPITAVDGSDDVSGVERMSIVVYFREKMFELGSFEYEQARMDFTNERRLNEDHPMWRPLWNGVSASQFTSQEWYDFLRKRDVKLLEQYHPEAFKGASSSLDSFFN